jgi:hypothetical protein
MGVIRSTHASSRLCPEWAILLQNARGSRPRGCDARRHVRSPVHSFLTRDIPCPKVPSLLIGPPREQTHPTNVGEGLCCLQDKRRTAPGAPTGTGLHEGSLVMQEWPEELSDMPGQDPSDPSPLRLTACPRRRPDVIARLLDGETVVLDRPAGLIHQLNYTASYIWARCDGQSTIAAIAHQLAQDFAVEPTVAARDVRVLVKQLQTLQLLE